MSTTGTPVSVTGGCNCESIRYTVTFPADFNWPAKENGTCQCTICRKFTGSLVPQSISVATSWISPPLSGSQTFKIYRSSSKGERGFCSDCGSSLTFKYIEQPERIELNLGTFDEEVLVGKKVGQKSSGEYGMHTTREKALGTLLCQTADSRNIWWENAIKDVTDDRPGLKYWRDVEDGKGFENEKVIPAS